MEGRERGSQGRGGQRRMEKRRGKEGDRWGRGEGSSSYHREEADKELVEPLSHELVLRVRLFPVGGGKKEGGKRGGARV